MSRPRIPVLALAVVSAIALSACDGDTAENNEYVDQVNEVISTLPRSVEAPPAGGGSPQQVSAALEQVAGELETAATAFEDIEPPEDVAGLHDSIVEDLSTLSSEATNAADEVAAGGAAGAVGVMSQLVVEANRIGAEIDQTITEIKNKLQE